MIAQLQKKSLFVLRLEFNFIITFAPVRCNTKQQSFETEHFFFNIRIIKIHRSYPRKYIIKMATGDNIFEFL